jgi:hypothetical protein
MREAVDRASSALRTSIAASAMKSPLASRAKTAVGDGDAVGGPVSRHLRRLARHSLTRSQLGLVHTCDHRSLRRHGSDELRIRRNLTRFDEPSESPRLGRARGFFVLTAVMLAACPTTDDRSNHRWSGMRRAGGDFSYRALLMDAITSSISAKSIEPLSRSLPAKATTSRQLFSMLERAFTSSQRK